MSASTDSKLNPTDNLVQDELSYCPPCFTLAGLVALYSNSNFTLGFSNAERQAAACALLKHESHLDSTHYQTRTLGGLHPAYVAFNKIPLFTERQSLTHEDFVKAGLEDVFDVLATQDCLDETITPDRIAVDLYVTPQELQEAPEQIGGDVSVLMQAFCEEFAIPHLKCFMECCSKENITPLHWYAATPVNPTGFLSLPAPLCPTGA
ncbi:hypothetical protein BDR03DRAFT_1015560 [Suillus americanus]|nr:hypothetical protein BDR03DRAFT_1015560 [Suillus americanus]